MMSKFDICVIGHITKEIIRVRGVEKSSPGGTAYYTSIPLQNLGWKVAVITKVAAEDQSFLFKPLKQDKITTFCRKSMETTIFENIYYGENLDQRVQKVKAIAAPFSCQDIASVSAPIFHLGPLTKKEIPLELLEELSTRGATISLDVQGFLRNVEENNVKECDWEEKKEGLAYVGILKASGHEAKILSGEADAARAASKLVEYGPKEVIITLGSKGSVICSDKTLYRIPAYTPRNLVDPTGCGDTYMAGYLYHRFQKPRNFDKIGRFAAKLATLNLETFGPVDKKKNKALIALKSNFGV